MSKVWIVTDYEQDYYGVQEAAFSSLDAAKGYVAAFGDDYLIEVSELDLDPPTPEVWHGPPIFRRAGRWVSVAGQSSEWTEHSWVEGSRTYVGVRPDDVVLESDVGEWRVSVSGPDEAEVAATFDALKADVIAAGEAQIRDGNEPGHWRFAGISSTTSSVLNFVEGIATAGCD